MGHEAGIHSENSSIAVRPEAAAVIEHSGTPPGDRAFRPDIQGLRAIAIALVVLDHAGVPRFNGGYVGVDVFFVVSGYVITGLLLREHSRTGNTSLLRFYARRARRILPASTIVIVGTLIAWGNNTGPNVQFTPATWQDGLEKTIHEIRPGVRVVVLGEIPHISLGGPECLSRHPGNVEECANRASAAVQAADNQAEAAAAAAMGASYLDVTPWFCAQVCPYEINGMDVYVGIYHITHTYAAYLSGVMQSALGQRFQTC